jgi:hypothetical protein
MSGRKTARQQVVYLLHFIDPATGRSARYQHAGHYRGTSDDLPARLQAHRDGTGARLMQVIKQAGLSFVLARTWPGGRDRERQLKREGGASRMCPECGVKPMPPRQPRATQRQQAYPARPAAPEPVGEYDFSDWPDLTAQATTAQAAELAATLRRGATAAYQAATREWPTPEDYSRAFDAALEADGAAQRAAIEAVAFHGREPDEHINEWITRIRQETPGRHQEEDMFGRERRAAARQRAAQQAEADALFAEADRWADLAGEPPDFRQQITRERAARIMQQLGEPLVRDARAAETEPGLTGAERDAEIDRLAALYPEPEAAGCGAQDQLIASSGTTQAARQREQAAAAQRIAPGAQREHPGPQASAAVTTATRQLHQAPTAHACADAGTYDATTRLQQAETAADPLPRLLEPADAAPLASTAWRLPDGTPHADPFLAGRGWQAQGGIYVRVPQAGLEAG